MKRIARNLAFVTWMAALASGFLTAQSTSASQFHLLSAPNPAWEAPLAGNSDSYAPILTPNADRILFTSAAENLCLITNRAVASFPARLNVFLRDRTNGVTSLVSVNTNGTAGGNGDSIALNISTNGRFALLQSSASDLVAGDTNAVKDIFVRDLTIGETVRVSVSTNGGNANGASRDAAFTPDGRYVAFVSAASNLVAGDTNGIPDIFVRDLQLNTTVLASPGATLSNALSSSEFPQISADGRYVVFQSTATNLVPGVETVGEIYLRDLVGGTTTWVSSEARAAFDTGATSTNSLSYNQVISADGRIVAFMVARQEGAFVLRYDRVTGATQLVDTNGYCPPLDRNLALTPSGRFLAYVSRILPVTNTCIRVWDADSATKTLASGDAAGVVAESAVSDWPAIDPSGRFVTFICREAALVTNLVDTNFHAYRRDLVTETTTLISVNTNGAGSRVSANGVPRVSEDGRFVAFEAPDGAFVAGDKNGAADIFLRDVLSNTTDLVSVRAPSLASETSDRVGALSEISVSTSGRFVAFVSDDRNLVANDTNEFRDVFVRDLVQGTTTLVSVNSNGWSGNGTSYQPSISGDGRYVAFTSAASDLAAKGTNKVWNVFVRDMQLAESKLVSVAHFGGSGGNGDSYEPQISTDGRLVLFRSKAGDIVSGTSGTNLFIKNIQLSITEAITTQGLRDGAMTPDGRYIAYVNTAGQLYIRDPNATVYTSSATSMSNLGISPGGNWVAYLQSGQLNARNWRTGTNWSIGTLASSAAWLKNPPRFSADERFLTYSSSNVYLFNLDNGSKTLVSKRHDSGDGGSGYSDGATLSHDGRFLAYRSAASNLISTVTNQWPGLFLYDRFAGTNRLLSSADDYWTFRPMFSGDGRFLVFPSAGSSFRSNDFNRGIDLFGYVFLYVTITDGPGGRIISWPVIPGESYLVEFKDSLDQPNWQTLLGIITLQDGQASIKDPATWHPHRFYRVVAF